MHRVEYGKLRLYFQFDCVWFSCTSEPKCLETPDDAPREDLRCIGHRLLQDLQLFQPLILIFGFSIVEATHL